jgi:hypothetical protein
MTVKKSTVLQRAKYSMSVGVDIYTWLMGTDKQFHKIGFSNGVPTVERIGDSVIELIDTEVEHYSKLKHNIQEI